MASDDSAILAPASRVTPFLGQSPARPVLGIRPPRPLILGLAGPAGCGKSTAATLLAGGSDWRRVSFADPLRDALLRLHPTWDLWHVAGPGKELTPADGGLSPREQLRVLGDWAKSYYPEFFVRIGLWAIGRHTAHGWHVVIDDVRFDAEAEAIRAMGGFVCHVSRTDVEFRRDHNSEQGITPMPPDLHLRNWGGVMALQAELTHLLGEMLIRVGAPA